MSYPDIKPNINIKPDPAGSAGPSRLPFTSTAGPSTGQPLGKQEDEELTLSIPAQGGAGWAVRVPTFLYEKWSMVQKEGVHLGTLQVDSSTTPAKIRLIIPKSTDSTSSNTNSAAGASSTNGSGSVKPEPQDSVKPEDLAAWSGYDTAFLPAAFDLNVPELRTQNTYIFKEKKRDSVAVRDGALGKRKREKAYPVVTNVVAHECQLHPVPDKDYDRILQARRKEHEVSRRPIQHMEDYADQGRINQLSSGHAAVRSTFGSGMASTSREPARSKDKLPRLERPALRDALFDRFREKPYWNISVLKETLKQPDVWLREVLRDVAEQVKEGPYRDMWRLKEALRALGPGVKGEDVKSIKGEQEEDGGEGEEEETDDDMLGGEGDDDFDEDDFEEIVG